jgi:hypothetical protein
LPPELFGALVLLASAIIGLIAAVLRLVRQRLDHDAEMKQQKHDTEMLLAKNKTEADAEIAKARADAEIEKLRLEAHMRAENESFVLETARGAQAELGRLRDRVDTLQLQLTELISRRADQERVIGEQAGRLSVMQEFVDRTIRERETELGNLGAMRFELERQAKEITDLKSRQETRHEAVNRAMGAQVEAEESLILVTADRDRLRDRVAELTTQVDALLLRQSPVPNINEPPLTSGDTGPLPAVDPVAASPLSLGHTPPRGVSVASMGGLV